MTEQAIDQFDSEKQERPAFLTVLCVLTWIVSAWVIMSVPFNYYFSSHETASTFQSSINDAMSQMAEADAESAKMVEGFMMAASDMISNGIKNAGWIAITDLLVAILSALGAFLMFKLRKPGFWLYVVAKVVGVASVLAFLGVNIVTMGAASLAGFVGLIMVIMYGVNRKYMS
ncbi:MAG: hypothetical protein WBG42_08840 [Cryomorphaceae bacterium]